MLRAEGRATALRRTTVFRFTTAACIVVALGVLALLGLIYARASVALDARSDAILARARDELLPSTAEALPGRIEALLRDNPSRSLHVALFSTTGALVAGNLLAAPSGLVPDGKARDTPAVRGAPELRALAMITPWGERLVIGREAASLLQVRTILLHALLWSGVAIAGLGLVAATLLSLPPLRRLRELEAVGREIASGRLDLRMPVSRRRDELDLFAGVVNAMVGEIARLVDEVRSTTDAAAHDLRTPLTRVRARLHRLANHAAEPGVRAELQEAIDDLDQVLERFAALLRISELEAQNRRAGFGPIDLSRLVDQAVELYGPLAEDLGVRLSGAAERNVNAEGDGRLLFEALGNLVDNAVKFSPPGLSVQITARSTGEGPLLIVRDHGPGVAEAEREAVLLRFHRGAAASGAQGHGLGLSLVAAIVRLHHFGLQLEDAHPGLRATIRCSPRPIEDPAGRQVNFISLGARRPFHP